MTDFELKWSEESVKEYVKSAFKGKNSLGIIAVVVCLCCFIAAAAVSISFYFTLRNDLMLILGGCSLLLGIIFIVVLFFFLKRTEKRITDTYKEETGLICAIGEKDILIVKNNIPVNAVKWAEINEITEGKTAFFLRSEEGMLLILEKDAVVSGELDEARQIITAKAAELDKRS